jgi:hypothetical protein
MPQMKRNRVTGKVEWSYAPNEKRKIIFNSVLEWCIALAIVGFIMALWAAFIGGIVYIIWNHILVGLIASVKPISFLAACALGFLVSLFMNLARGSSKE